MIAAEREFPIEAVISISTGRLVCKIEALYEILNYMTGQNLYTHQLPRASRAASVLLKKQYPQLILLCQRRLDELLAGLPDHLRMAACGEWVRGEVNRLGLSEKVSIPMISEDDYPAQGPLAELREMAPDKPVLVIVRSSQAKTP